MPTDLSRDQWFAPALASADVAVRLVCLPFAGAGASVFARWGALLGSDVGVLPIHLAGREARFHEAPETDIDRLAVAMAAALAPVLDRPFAIFGWSMGALIGHRLALALREMGVGEPLRFIVGAHRPPGSLLPGPVMHRLPSAEFWRCLSQFGGTPDAVLANAELRALLEPVLRADFQLVETAPPPPTTRLACPVTAISALADPMIAPDLLKGWRIITEGPFDHQQVEGGHFAITSAPSTIATIIRDRVMRDLGRHLESDAHAQA